MKSFRMILLLALILCFMVSCQDKEAMAELEAMKAQAEIEEQNKEIIRRWIEEVNKENAIEVKFPFRGGNYYIAHGGASALINHHWPALTSGYAIDIIKLNRFGFRALGFYPKNLSKYYIFGDTVYSPIDGAVVRAVDGLPDMPPPKSDKENPYGNHLIIKHSKENAYIYLLHLQQNSIHVKVGEIVQTGKPIGKAGNSGSTTEPHLHIHCEIDSDIDSKDGGKRVPLLFSGRFPSRNDLVKI
jgi:murein DD-endopeptidase MepM/ murein hydrolase activator NlpD